MLYPGAMKSLAACLVAVVCAGAPASASAQRGPEPPGTAPPGAYEQPAPPPSAESFEPNSPQVALAWSLLSTGIGYAALYGAGEYDNGALAFVAVAGTLVGPSAGDIYAGDGSRALVHTGIRGGALLLTAVGAVQTFDDCFLAEDSCNSDGEVLMVGGLALFVGSSIYSIATAPRTAREQNEKARRLMVAPTPIPNGTGQYGLGLSLTGEL